MSEQTLRSRFDAKYQVDPGTGCWLWTAASFPEGYGQICVRRNGKWRTERAHRVAWQLHCGSISPGLCVLHRCDTPACVNPDHLFLGTKGDNNVDKIQKGRQTRGAQHGSAKLTEAEVREIHRQIAAGHSQRQIAREFGVDSSLISLIRHGKCWSHLQEVVA